jgi:hypothetical protein
MRPYGFPRPTTHKMQRGKGEKEQRGKRTLPFSPFRLFSFSFLAWEWTIQR